MTIKITLEFNNAAEAIVALDRLIGSPAPAKNPPVEASQAAQAPVAGEPARGRGRPKGSTKNKTAGDPPAVATKAVVPEQPVELPVAAVKAATEQDAPRGTAVRDVPGTTAPIPGPRDVVAALQKVLTAKGMPTTQVVFQRWGVTRGAEVKEEDRAKFIAYCEDVAAGKIDPAKSEGLPT